jgi:RNA polymerase sigma-70 factor (ECF subfamily)
LAKAHLSIKAEINSASEIPDVVARSQRGDQEAFHHLFRRYSKPILSFIYDMVGDQGQAEELTQETFVRAYKSLGNLKETGKFSTWLFGIAKNIAREAIKEKYQQQRQVGLDEPASQHLADGKIAPDEKMINSEINGEIRRALLDLNEDWRAIFILKIFHQKSYEEIAEITGWSVAKIKTDLHRARLEIRRRLERFMRR